MYKDKTVAILGGDMRQAAVADTMLSRGPSVRVFGLPAEVLGAGILHISDWREAVKGVDAVVLPLPASPDSLRVHLPLMPEIKAPLFGELFHFLPRSVLIAGGKFSPGVKAMAEEFDRTLFDYFESEALQLKNALPTAEGAVAILMREVPRTVSGLPVVVTGYGRVARALVKLLLAMEAKVTVAARKLSDLEAAAALGCSVLPLDGEGALRRVSSGFAAVFNTVPYWLFDEKILAGMEQSTLLIDLASAPGGVDAASAAKHGIRAIWALSLPGKYAPVTAGEIIAETVLERMKEEGII